MAVLAAAQLLDELMGRNRNVAPHEKGAELNWEDSEYCKYFLVKFCPHDLFVNTRADLGACTKVHDEEIRKLFASETSRLHKKVFYQEEFVRFCASMVNEVDRKIVKGKQRLALSGKHSSGEGVSSLSPQQTQLNLEQIQLLNERVNGLVEEAEAAGNAGNVEQAQGLMRLCDQLKDERDQLKKMNENSHWSATAELAAAQEKQMEVCEVCGAFLIVGDAQQRIDDHLMGKQHVGYARLKAAIQEVQQVIDEARAKDGSRERTNSGRRGNNGPGPGGGGLGSIGSGGGGDRNREHYHRGDGGKRDGKNSFSRDSSSNRDNRDTRDRGDNKDRNDMRDRNKHHSRAQYPLFGGGGGAERGNSNGGGGGSGGPYRNREHRRHHNHHNQHHQNNQHGQHHRGGGGGGGESTFGRDRDRDRGGNSTGSGGSGSGRHSHRR